MNVNKKNILNFLKKGGIPIITGFQGVNSENRVTTIGRGGTDASAIMLANFLKQKNVLFILMSMEYTPLIQEWSQKQKKLKNFL